MSAELDKARELFANGEDKQALEALKRVESALHVLMLDRSLGGDDKDEAEGLLEIASAIRERNDGKTRRRAESLVVDAKHYLELIARRPVPTLATLSDFRVVSSEGLGVSPDQVVELVFTTKAALVRSSKGDALELARLEYPEITHIGFRELPQPQGAARRVGKGAGKAALGMSLGMLLGSGDAGWSAAGKLTETHTVQMTILTSRGSIVLVRKSPATPEDLQSRVGQVLKRIGQPARHAGVNTDAPPSDHELPPISPQRATIPRAHRPDLRQRNAHQMGDSLQQGWSVSTRSGFKRALLLIRAGVLDFFTMVGALFLAGWSRLVGAVFRSGDRLAGAGWSQLPRRLTTILGTLGKWSVTILGTLGKWLIVALAAVVTALGAVLVFALMILSFLEGGWLSDEDNKKSS